MQKSFCAVSDWLFFLYRKIRIAESSSSSASISIFSCWPAHRATSLFSCQRAHATLLAALSYLVFLAGILVITAVASAREQVPAGPEPSQKQERAHERLPIQRQVPAGARSEGKEQAQPATKGQAPQPVDEPAMAEEAKPDTTATTHVTTITTIVHIEILLWIIIAGAFGGFVDGLIASRPYALRWKTTTIDIGSLGDILVGAAASIAIFTIASALFELRLKELQEPDKFMRLIAWGVLSGFAGLRILQGMSEKLVQDIATKVAEDTVKKVLVQDVDMEINIRAGEAALTKYDIAKEGDWKQIDEGAAKKLLDVALLKFDAALSRQSDNEMALRDKAKVYRRIAEFEGRKGNATAEKENWNKAIGILTSIINRSPTSSLAHYNLACYLHLSKADLKDVMDNLCKALNIAPTLKENAKSDPDFASIKENPEFKKIV